MQNTRVRINLLAKNVQLGFRAGVAASGAFIRKNSGKIIYYTFVAIALCAIACAAEKLRSGKAPDAGVLVLPAAELAPSAAMEKELSIRLQPGMEIIRGYSAVPEWNKLLGQWETHMGTDFSCPENRVESLCEGVVETVGESGVCGGFIEIAAGEFLLRYASMDVAAELEPGDALMPGDFLGFADESMPGEAHMGPHIHVELYQNGRIAELEDELEKNPADDD